MNVKELDVQIQKERDHMSELYAQIKECEKRDERLLVERKAAEVSEKEAFIDKWFRDNFGIQNQKEARMRSVFLVFDEYGKFVKTVTTGYGEAFPYVGPIKDEDTLEHWLSKNKLYAHRASSFCDRNPDWYKKTFKDQLENLGWTFCKNGKLKATKW